MQPDLLELLYRKYYKATYLYTISLCKQKELAEDIVSQAFEKAYLSLKGEKLGFQYWLLTVCKHLWLDYLRKNKRIRLEYEQELEGTSPNLTPESEFLKKEKDELVFECLLQLPPKYREILTLHYYADIPIKEIAILMGLSNSNAKTLIHRARMKLKKILEEQDYEF